MTTQPSYDPRTLLSPFKSISLKCDKLHKQLAEVTAERDELKSRMMPKQLIDEKVATLLCMMRERITELELRETTARCSYEVAGFGYKKLCQSLGVPDDALLEHAIHRAEMLVSANPNGKRPKE